MTVRVEKTWNIKPKCNSCNKQSYVIFHARDFNLEYKSIYLCKECADILMNEYDFIEKEE